MKCPYINPTYECLNCHYDDCIREEGQDEAERKALYRKLHPDAVKKSRRSQYIKNQEKEKSYQREHYQRIKDEPDYKKYRAEYNKAYKAKVKAEKDKVKQFTSQQ